MRVLSLDTTTRRASMALVVDDTIVCQVEGDSSLAHAERLPGDLLTVLEKAGVALSDVDLFAVAAGPGSFTGLRIGIATMQGLAFTTGRRIVAVSVLEALGQAGSEGQPAGSLVGAWMDARRHDVFSALYRVTAEPVFSRSRLVEIDPPRVDSPAAILVEWRSLGWPAVFIGDGATLYRSTIGDGDRVKPLPPLAGVIGRLALDRARAGESVDPAGVQPLYVRRPDAEIARDERSARGIRAGDSS